MLYNQGINIHLAKKMIEDRSRDYMNARRVAKVRCSSWTSNATGMQSHDQSAVAASSPPSSIVVTSTAVYPPGIRDRDEGAGSERSLCAPSELSTGGAAGGDVEEVHPVGEEQPAAHRRPDPHHKER